MTNTSKAKGTWAETAVTRYAALNGFPHAERRALAGNGDLGDILLAPFVIAEVKAGKVAEACADAWLAEAQRQTLAEQRNSKASIALLVCKRKAVGAANAGQWWAWMPLSQAAELYAPDVDFLYHVASPDFPWIRMTLAEALRLIRHGGYGTALTYTEKAAA